MAQAADVHSRRRARPRSLLLRCRRRRTPLLPVLGSTTNHKDIGTLYLIFALLWPVLPRSSSFAMRLEIAGAGPADSRTLQAIRFAHGATALLMVFFMVMPAADRPASATGWCRWMIGAPDMAFPRMNMLSYWLVAVRRLHDLASLIAPGCSARTGWTVYPPLSHTVAGHPARPCASRHPPGVHAAGHDGAINYGDHLQTARAGHDDAPDAAVRLLDAGSRRSCSCWRCRLRGPSRCC